MTVSRWCISAAVWAAAIWVCACVCCSGPEDILHLVASSLPANTKLAVFDAVTSNTALVLPVQELVQLCRYR